MELGLSKLVKDYDGTPKIYARYELITNVEPGMTLVLGKDEIDKEQEIIHVKIRDPKTGKFSHIHLKVQVSSGKVYAILDTSAGTGTKSAPMKWRRREALATPWDEKARYESI